MQFVRITQRAFSACSIGSLCIDERSGLERKGGTDLFDDIECCHRCQQRFTHLFAETGAVP